MADISISPVQTSISTPNSALRNTNTDARSAGAKAAEKLKETSDAQKERGAEVRREQLEDVIAVSKDGDTVQATDTSKERLAEDAFGHMEIRQDQQAQQDQQTQQAQELQADRQDMQSIRDGQAQTVTGEVTEEAIEARTLAAIEGTESQQAMEERTKETLENGTKTEEAISESTQRQLNGTSRTEQAIEIGNQRADEEEAEEEYNNKIETYNGVSDMRLEQMYIQGEISKTDYDKEMEAREERREAENADDSRFSNQMTGAAVLEERGERDLEQIETAFSPEANDTIAGEDRMEILAALDANTLNTQADANVVTDATASGEEAVRRVVFS
ncbi:MAG: hypothetical protein K6G42_04630 [Lachnospiraceae bacterium]|nr:hypothetical protein [Lachnospiraceae bacterium]